MRSPESSNRHRILELSDMRKVATCRPSHVPLSPRLGGTRVGMATVASRPTVAQLRSARLRRQNAALGAGVKLDCRRKSTLRGEHRTITDVSIPPTVPLVNLDPGS